MQLSTALSHVVSLFRQERARNALLRLVIEESKVHLIYSLVTSSNKTFIDVIRKLKVENYLVCSFRNVCL